MISPTALVIATLAVLSSSDLGPMPSMIGRTVVDPCGTHPQSVRINDLADETENLHLLARSFLMQEGLPKYLVCDFAQKPAANVETMTTIAIRRTSTYSDEELAIGRLIVRRVSSINLDRMEEAINGIEALSRSGNYDAATVQEMQELVRNSRQDIRDERERLNAP